MSENKPYNIIVFREYTDKNGEVKTRGHEVGVAFKTKDGSGFNGELVEGIALTGRFAILPRRDRQDERETGEEG